MVLRLKGTAIKNINWNELKNILSSSSTTVRYLSFQLKAAFELCLKKANRVLRYLTAELACRTEIAALSFHAINLLSITILASRVPYLDVTRNCSPVPWPAACT